MKASARTGGRPSTLKSQSESVCPCRFGRRSTRMNCWGGLATGGVTDSDGARRSAESARRDRRKSNTEIPSRNHGRNYGIRWLTKLEIKSDSVVWTQVSGPKQTGPHEVWSRQGGWSSNDA